MSLVENHVSPKARQAERDRSRKKYVKELKAIQKNEETTYESQVMAATLMFLLEE